VTARSPEPRAADSNVAVAMLARSPRAEGKTRLTADLDPLLAAALRTALLLDAIDAALAAGWPLHVFVDPPEDASLVWTLMTDDRVLAGMADWCHLHAQAGGDLGERMTDAMARTLALGHDVVVLVGSDAPDLPVAILRDAARRAGDSAPDAGPPLVLGPADDGGFYLVAARRADPRTFAGVTWSQSSVLADVQARAGAAGREVVLVAPWRDVDTPDDLRALLARSGTGAPRTRAIASRLPLHARGGAGA
jgi:rSAM/selenodomain-associated transferase 1